MPRQTRRSGALCPGSNARLAAVRQTICAPRRHILCAAQTHNEGVRIRIEACDLPGSSCGPSPDRPGGYHNIHVGVQRRSRRDELLDLVPGDAPYATWTVDCTAMPTPTGVDLRGPYIQGPPGGRFIYLSWGTVDDNKNFTLFRRAKVWLDAIPAVRTGQRPGVGSARWASGPDRSQRESSVCCRAASSDRVGSRGCALTLGCPAGASCPVCWRGPKDT